MDFNSTQKDEEMELSTTAGKKVVDVTFTVDDGNENSVAAVLDQEIDALQIKQDLASAGSQPGLILLGFSLILIFLCFFSYF